jgi:hypothetical protein
MAVTSSQSVDWLVEGFRILKKAAVIGSFFVPGFLQTVAERGLNVPFFHPQISLRLGRHASHFNLVECPFHHQSHTVRHSAQGQRHRAAGAVEVVGEVAGDDADGQEVFGGVGHEGFGVGAGGEFEEAVFTFGMWFDGWFEMVVEGAFGGFVEFL